jgi:hypothetical protein
MTDILIKSLDALWQVALVGLVVGAGLPALFAVGVRSLNSGRVLTAGAGGTTTSAPSAAGRAGAYLCFGVCIAAVLFGIVVIVYGKQLFGV